MTNEEKVVKDNSRLVEQYFGHVSDLWEGKEGTVDKFMSLWHPDGIFEFTGSPAVQAVFQGANAIQVLYRNRSRANSMGLRLTSKPDKPAIERFCTLAQLRPNLRKCKASTKGAMASWHTELETGDKQGFVMTGTHEFVIEGGRIKSLKVTISKKPTALDGVSMNDLSVADIGRLSLAAWAVV